MSTGDDIAFIRLALACMVTVDGIKALATFNRLHRQAHEMPAPKGWTEVEAGLEGPVSSEGRRVCRAFDYHEEMENIQLGIVERRKVSR